MKIAPGLTNHTVVVCAATRDRGVRMQMMLNEAGYRTVISTSLYDALRSIAQEMPHVILSEALLPDGTAGTLFDRLKQHKILCQTPILVHVIKKSPEELRPIANRQFAGFVAGNIDKATLTGKISEVLQGTREASPYFVPTDQLTLDEGVMITIDSHVVCIEDSTLVCRSNTPVDPDALLICNPKNPSIGAPVVLRNGSNIHRPDEVYNMFPVQRIVGEGRKWLMNLEKIDPKLLEKKEQAADAGEPAEVRRVVMYIDNDEYLRGFQDVLAGHDIEVVSANSITDAAEMVKKSPHMFGCVYIHEFKSDKDRVEWHNATCMIPVQKKPTVVVGSHQRRTSQSPDLRYIHKPYGLGYLIEALEFAFKRASSIAKYASKHAVGGPAGVSTFYQMKAKLVGLDEIGGIIETSVPLVKNSKIHLNHSFLQDAWNGSSNVVISSCAQLPGEGDVFQARFEAVGAGMSKTKYWEKLSGLLAALRKNVEGGSFGIEAPAEEFDHEEDTSHELEEGGLIEVSDDDLEADLNSIGLADSDADDDLEDLEESLDDAI